MANANPNVHDPQAAQHAAEAAAKARKEHEDNVRKGIAERSAAQKKISEDYNAMAAKAKPTPTNEECDLIKMGIPIDEKEPDGSPSHDEHVTRIMEARTPGKNPYETRTAPRQGRSGGHT